MAKQKRRSGGGRKPLGEIAKTATFTTRIEPATRRALDEATRKSRHGSVSATAEFILKQGLKQPSGEPRNYAVGAAIALLAERIEAETKLNWREDPFTGFALSYAAEHFLFHFAPAPEREGMPPVPPAIKEAAAKMNSEFADNFCKPHFFGRMLADFLIREIKEAAASAPPNEWSMPIFFSEKPAQLALIGQHLGLSKKGKSK
jgi:hypothetical protein